ELREARGPEGLGGRARRDGAHGSRAGRPPRGARAHRGGPRGRAQGRRPPRRGERALRPRPDPPRPREERRRPRASRRGARRRARHRGPGRRGARPDRGRRGLDRDGRHGRRAASARCGGAASASPRADAAARPLRARARRAPPRSGAERRRALAPRGRADARPRARLRSDRARGGEKARRARAGFQDRLSAAFVRELDLRSARGERLAGVLHEPESAPRGLAVIAPCFTCTRDIAPVRNLARDLAEAGFRACRYDPIGSGKSEGRFEDATLSLYRDDLVAVASALRGAEALFLIGHSLGGATSLLAASQLPPRAVVTLATNARKDSLRRLLGADAFERAKREGSVPFDSGDGVLRPLTRAFCEDLEGHDVLAAAEALA